MTDQSSTPPVILWLRRDLRLRDHPGWEKALAAKAPIIPVFIRDPLLDDITGAAALWRLGQSLESLDAQLRAKGSRLILRAGDALEVLRGLIAETGAKQVIWSRQYDSRSIERDRKIKAALTDAGIDASSVNSHLLFEPWTVETKTGGCYRVYSPFWKAVRDIEVPEPLRVPPDLHAPESWPASEKLTDWKLGAAMRRGAAVLARHAVVGEDAAQTRLMDFLEDEVGAYKEKRDRLDATATSKLSENLTYGEISPREIWHRGMAAMREIDRPGQAEHFLKELAWREFAYHLLYHTPRIQHDNWREEWDDFPWRDDNPDAERWKKGLTGIEVVDAAMREMYVTGYMHNRARMLVASFLTKHLMTHWKVGEAWFRDCLTDWDVASNAMGWQWTAGSGPDAAPYFRVFNPDTQAQKFDPDRRYRDRWLAEGRRTPSEDALSYFDAVPKSWGIGPESPYPEPMIDLKRGRERALQAYSKRNKAA